MHANFSNGAMREQGGEALFKKICEEFGKNIDRHISVYGADNNQRLTGLHETQSIDIQLWSFRPWCIHSYSSWTIYDGWKGRLKTAVQHRMVILTVCGCNHQNYEGAFASFSFFLFFKRRWLIPSPFLFSFSSPLRIRLHLL